MSAHSADDSAAAVAQTPAALPHVMAIEPYTGGRPIEDVARDLGLDPATIIKLASNENPLGMAPAARTALAHAIQGDLAGLGRYPDSNGFALKAALAAQLKVGADFLTLGNGSNDLLELAAAAFLQAGRSAIFSQYSFAVYPLAVQARGARAIVIPAVDFGHDLDAFLRAIAPDTALIFVANPNNPTGTWLPPAVLERFLSRVPTRIAVVLDEAYNEYLAPEDRADSLSWVRRFPNLILSRTFSKAYGLAALRVGYAVAQPALTAILNRVRHPFNVSSLAQIAAVAALGDHEFLHRSYALNRAGLTQLGDGMAALGLKVVPSRGNFVLAEVGDAAAIYQALLRQGVIVRPVGTYGLPNFLRISVGLPEENTRFLGALKTALANSRAGTRP